MYKFLAETIMDLTNFFLIHSNNVNKHIKESNELNKKEKTIKM